jgi:hypothetical protein
MHHWHTVSLDIPCQVARLQSLIPLLQAMIHFTLANDTTPLTGGYEKQVRQDPRQDRERD